MLAQIGQAMLTDFAAMTLLAGILMLAALLTRKKREQSPRALVLVRRAILLAAAIGCTLGAELTAAHGALLALFIVIAELGAWP